MNIILNPKTIFEDGRGQYLCVYPFSQDETERGSPKDLLLEEFHYWFDDLHVPNPVLQKFLTASITQCQSLALGRTVRP